MNILGLLLLLVTNISFAGDRVGNGGDVLICNEPLGERIYVLEEYENKYSLRIGRKDLSYEDKVNILIERIKKHFPARYNSYLNIFANFRANATYIGKGLPDINDSLESPSINCVIYQAAYFKRANTNKISYYIQEGVWSSLNNDQKAVLVFHEILYTEAAGLGHTNSFHVRQANRLVFSGDNFDPALFDEHFLLPLRGLPESLILDQLQNAYSERIAIYLLQKDLSEYYGDNNLRSRLVTLRERFNTNKSVVKLIDFHLRLMNIPHS